jgi:hypothetical protein
MSRKGAAFPSPARSLFDGTWRPDYQPLGPDSMPEVIGLADGMYECDSCEPPYRLPADGQEHAIDSNPRFETLAISVVDDWTLRQVGRRAGAVVFESTTTVTPDSMSRTETRTASMKTGDVFVPIISGLTSEADEVPRLVKFRSAAARIGQPAADQHLVAGRWRTIEIDLLDHDEDTTYRIADRELTMTDRMGRSFTAPLDGTVAPYQGDARFSAVSVRMIDHRTIEESNLSGEVVVQVTRWQVDADGRTMHVRFDDTHGHVMEQTGHKLA